MADTEVIKEIKVQSITIQERVKTLVIKSDNDLIPARDAVQDIKAFIAKIHEKLDKNVKTADELHKGLVKERNEYLLPLKTLQATIEDKIKAFIVEKEVAAKKEQSRLNELARQEAEAAQMKADKKIAALMEKAGGLQGQIDALTEALHAPDVTEAETGQIERQIDALHRKLEAATEKAEMVQVMAEQSVVVPVVVQTTTKVAGMSVGKRTVLVSVDLKTLASAVGAGTIPVTVLSANEGAIIKLIDAGLDLARAGVVHRQVPKIGVRS
jgi:hypothetical protein